MASMLKCSRHSVREALRILEAREVLYVKTGSGAFINSKDSESIIAKIHLTACTDIELQELQLVLDRHMVCNVINNSPESEKKELIKIANEMIILADNDIYSHTLDHSFHEKIYVNGKNSAISQLIKEIRNIHFVQQENSDIGNTSIWLETIHEHLKLAEAILEQNEKEAIKYIDYINNHVFKLKN